MLAAFFRRNAAPATGDLSGPWIGSEARDRKLLTAAGGVALAIHMAVMLLPLPEGRDLPQVVVVDTQPPTIVRTRLEPPAPPQVHETEVAPIPARRPYPVVDPPPHEPVREATSITQVVDLSNVPVAATVVGAVSAPLVPPEVYPEWKPGLMLPVAVAGRVKPAYPPIGLALGKEGVVVLRAVITTEGRVESVRVIQSPIPDPGFTEEAIAAVSQWRYEPGLLHGRPVAVELTVRVEFMLDR